MKNQLPIYIFLLVVILMACTRLPFSEINKDVRPILDKCIQAHGGIDAWDALKGLSYTKEFSLLYEDGAVEKAFSQIHSYQMPTKTYTIENTNADGSEEVTYLKDGTYKHTSNGATTDKSIESIQKSINSSVYVIGIPFKLLDPGATLKYGGIEEIEGRKAHVISAAYDPAKSANHSTKDVWWYYIDTSTHRVIANKVKTGDHWAWIENLTYDEEAKILFNKHRKSYRIDSLGNKLYLRAEYMYDNYKLTF